MERKFKIYVENFPNTIQSKNTGCFNNVAQKQIQHEICVLGKAEQSRYFSNFPSLGLHCHRVSVFIGLSLKSSPLA